MTKGQHVQALTGDLENCLGQRHDRGHVLGVVKNGFDLFVLCYGLPTRLNLGDSKHGSITKENRIFLSGLNDSETLIRVEGPTLKNVWGLTLNDLGLVFRDPLKALRLHRRIALINKTKAIRGFGTEPAQTNDTRKFEASASPVPVALFV